MSIKISQDPLEQASAILGEHMVNYLIVCTPPDSPNKCTMSYDSKYAASGLIKHAKNVIESDIDIDSEYELVWDEEEDEE